MEYVLNLTEGYKPLIDKTYIPELSHESSNFPDNSPYIRIIRPKGKVSRVTVTLRGNDMVGLFRLALAKDALDRMFGVLVDLHCPYFPGSRSDHISNDGEGLGVEVFTNYINSLGFNIVEIQDEHSNETSSRLNCCHVLDSNEMIFNILQNIGGDICVIQPDLGSHGRHFTHDIRRLISGTYKLYKTRDDGPIFKGITFTKPLTHRKYEHYVVIDDCCSNGRTFTSLAKQFKEEFGGKRHLIVTHFDGGCDREFAERSISEYYDSFHYSNSLLD